MNRHSSSSLIGVLSVLLLASWIPAISEDTKKESCIPKVAAEFIGKVVSDGDTLTVLTPTTAGDGATERDRRA